MDRCLSARFSCSHICHQHLKLLRVALSGSRLQWGNWSDWGNNRLGLNLYIFQVVSQFISLHRIQLIQQFFLVLLSDGNKKFLPFLNLLLNFSHLFLEFLDGIDVYLVVHLSDGVVALFQALDHFDISVGGPDGHFLTLEHNLLAVKLF